MRWAASWVSRGDEQGTVYGLACADALPAAMPGGNVQANPPLAPPRTAA
jgi:hypothetical protein